MQLYAAGTNILRDTNLEPNPLNAGAEEASVLLEYYSRNGLTNSNAFGHGNWATVTPNAAIAPDGTMTAWELAETAVDVYHQANNFFANALGGVYSVSIFAKAGTRTRMWFNNADHDGGTPLIMNLTTGAIIQNASFGSTVVLDSGNGWWEIRVTIATQASDGVFAWGTVNNSNQTSFLGDTAMHIFLWNGGGFMNRPICSSTIISVGNQNGAPPPTGFADPGEVAFGTGRWMDSPLQIPFSSAPQAMSGLIEFIEKGSAQTPGAGIWSIGNYILASPSLQIGTGAAGYRIIHNNGGNVTSSLAAFPTIGQLVRLRWTLRGDGSVQIWQSINGAAEVAAASSAASSLAVAWSEGYSWLNGLGASSQGYIAYRQSVVLPGADIDLATLLSHFT